jgi:Fungal specific transcription factor domain
MPFERRIDFSLLKNLTEMEQYPLTPGQSTESIDSSGSNRVVKINPNSFQKIASMNLTVDLPELPSMEILTSLLELYFEKVSPILNIIQPGKFAYDFNSLVNNHHQEAAPSKANSYDLVSASSAVTPALVFSMLALAAPHHILFLEKGDIIKSMFYERSRKLVLQTPEKMTLAVLKTTIHLCYFAVQHQLWTSAYYFHGYNVSVCRFLKITFLDLHPLSDNTPAGKIVAEESRRCFWNVICSDAAAAANSKRSHYFHNPEFENVFLPNTDTNFYNDEAKNLMPTLNISQFFNPNSTALFLDPISSSPFL